MRKKSFIKAFLLVVLVAVIILATISYFSPLPPTKLNIKSISPSTSSTTALAWPAYGQASLGTADNGLLQSNGEQKAVPTASVAKVITALAVLQKQPLTLNQSGPDIELSATDVGYFNSHYQNGGSVVKVIDGEKISQYKALQAMLLPSANNMADSLALWAFGSQANYIDYANNMLKKMGLSKTIVADASGFSPNTVSTSNELLSIGLKAMQNPVLAEIVSQPTATIPVAGEIKNVNWLLGSEGVVGIKTGSTDQAGGNFLFAANRKVLGENIILVGDILGAPNRNLAISDSKNLIKSADTNFEKKTLLNKNQIVATYATVWGDKVNAVIKNDCNVVGWKAQQAVFKTNLITLSAGTNQGTEVGKVTATLGKQNVVCVVVLDQKIAGPSLTWRIFN